jgi:hypothetical protein
MTPLQLDVLKGLVKRDADNQILTLHEFVEISEIIKEQEEK